VVPLGARPAAPRAPSGPRGPAERWLPASLGGGRPGRRKQDAHLEEVIGELAAWSAVNGHKHVVGFVSAMVEGNRVFMVMERCETSIIHKVSNSPGFWVVESRRVMKEMLLGVQACHLVDIVHRDIKPQNYLLAADGSTVKLCDFGLAARMPCPGQLLGLAGTIPYMSPEMLRGSGYGKATDMWSYGVMAYLLCFGAFPYTPDASSRGGMKRAIPRLGHPAPRLARGGGVAALVERQLELCPAARCTAEEALAHWYLQEKAPPRARRRRSPGAPPTRARRPPRPLRGRSPSPPASARPAHGASEAFGQTWTSEAQV
ncbi:unnamed protein product, partial [Prorocentrum cordatum]